MSVKMRKRMFMGAILLTVGIIGLIGVNGLLRKDENVNENNIYSNKWALCNYGQSIENSDGVEGVDINVIKAWEITQGSSDVIVGVVDTGVDISLDIFVDTLWYNKGEIPENSIDDDNNGYVDDYNGWDFYNNDASIYDDYLYDYHGTYLSSIILDVAPQTQILSCKFLRGTEGDAMDSIDAIQYAIDNGATIINCSWCFESEQIELYELMKDNKDILFVCAAGNSRLNLDENAVYPACYELDNVISVMAIDNTGVMYDISGYGLSVDLAAPGKNIYVLLPEDESTFVSGTSASTAFVTAIAALMKSVNNELTPSEIKKILIETTQKLDSLKGICASGGCVDAYEAIKNFN